MSNNYSKDLALLEQEILSASNKEKAKFLERFFCTGVGQYAEGDIFLGITVPIQRAIAKRHTNLKMDDIKFLLNSREHEKRLIALLIMIFQFQKAIKINDNETAEAIVNFYLNQTQNINNWDLVDLSAPKILGEWLVNKDRKILTNLANSNLLWDRRIAIVSTYSFIRLNDFQTTFTVSNILLHDQHDLIHKAVGWMLREIGKRDISQLDHFLASHYKKMPRTMLRYAIEKHPEPIRQAYLLGKK